MENNKELRALSYEIYNKFLVKSIDDLQNAFIVGGKIKKALPLWNMIFLLLQMRHEDYASARPTEEEINCMIDKLLCNGIDANKLADLWPASYPKEDGLLDGIGYMQIEGLGIDHTIFRIK